MKLIACVLAVVCVAIAAALIVAMPAVSAPQLQAGAGDDLASLSFRPHPGVRLPLDEQLLDERGQAVELASYFGRSPVILVLEYLRCTSLCGVTLRNLVDLLSATPLEGGRDYQLVAISIDPRDQPRDAASAAAEYGGRLHRAGTAAGLHVLTGRSEAVRRIADAIGFPYRYDRLLDAYIHPAGFVVASPGGLISRYVEGVAVSSSDMVSALADAQHERPAGLLTRLALLCHVQGAPLGRWTVAVMAAFMALDVAAGVGAIAIFALVRRDRPRIYT